MINANFVILGSLITLAGGLSYLIDTLRGNIQPNRISWFLWALAPFIAFGAEIKQGVGMQSLLTLTVGLIPAMVFCGSFFNPHAYWKIQRLDIICAVLSLAGLFLWYITRVGNIAILFAIFSDATASFPTLVKAYHDPKTENYHIFAANALSAIITMLTISTWNFQSFAFPLYLFLMMGAIAIVIKFKIGWLLHKSAFQS